MIPTKNIWALAATLCLALGLHAQTTYYWIGSGGSWATASNWSLSSGGSASTVAPGATDIAVFDANGGDCTLAANATIGEVVLGAGYANTLDLDGHSLSVAGGFTQHAGTFQGGSAAVGVGGTLHLIGGEYHATTGTTTVGADIIEEGEYLYPQGGKFILTGTGAAIDIASFFYDLEIGTGASAVLGNGMAVAHNLHLGGPLNAGEHTVFIGTSSATAITGGSGIYLALGAEAYGIVYWGIGESTGTYTVPMLATPTGPVIPVAMDVTTAGDAGTGPYDGFVMFLCIELDDTKPQDMLPNGGYYDATGGNNADMNINRLWGLVLSGYDESPGFDLGLAYADADLTGIAATEANLRGQVHDEKHWTGTMGTLNATANTLALTGLSLPTDGRASFVTLVDNTSPNKSTYGGNTGLTCADAVELDSIVLGETDIVMVDTVMWFRFTATDSFINLGSFCASYNFLDVFNISKMELLYGGCIQQTLIDDAEQQQHNSYLSMHSENVVNDSIYLIKIYSSAFSWFNILKNTKKSSLQYADGFVRIKVIDSIGIPLKPTDSTYLFTDFGIDSTLQAFGLSKFDRMYNSPDEETIVFFDVEKYYEATCSGNIAHFIEALKSYPTVFDSVEWVERIPLYDPNDYGTNGGYIVAQTDLDLINAKQAWNVTQGQPNIIAGNGEKINPLHEDLANQLESVGNAFSSNSQNHGTFVAGCIAAATNNDLGISSIGFKTKLVIGNHIHAINSGVRVYNYSHGSFNSSYRGEIDNLINNKVIVTGGAGNGRCWEFRAKNCPDSIPCEDCDRWLFAQGTFMDCENAQFGSGTCRFYPSSYPEVISVTSVAHSNLNPPNQRDALIQDTANIFSGHTKNEWVDIAAPGYGVIGLTYNGYSVGTGTSFASPMVAGVASLILSVNPCLSPEQVFSIITTTAADISTVPGNSQFNGLYGAGRVDAYAAVIEAMYGLNYMVQDDTITEDTIWVSIPEMKGNVLITNGAVLTIFGELNMGFNTKIIVDRGAKLILDSATIKNSCGWYGIEVWGIDSLQHPSISSVEYGTYPSSSNHHGVVIVKNSSIEQAQIGILSGRNTGNPSSDKYYAGGVVIVDSSFLRNNLVGIGFNPFSHPSISYVKNSVFALKQKYESLEGISLRRVKGITLENNEFLGDFRLSDFYKQVGINAYESQYTCKHSYFSELHIGIQTLNSAISIPSTQIKQNTFNTYIGLYLSGSENIHVENDSFYLTEELNKTSIYMSGLNIFNIRKNHFQNIGIFSGLSQEMIYCKGSGLAANELRQNKLLFLDFFNPSNARGIITSGNNSGLKIRCNDFGPFIPSQDYSYTGNIDIYGPIAELQGLCGTNQSPANNYFADDCGFSSTTGIHIFTNPGVPYFAYRFLDNNTRFEPDTGCVKMGSLFDVIPCAQVGTSTDYCPDRYGLVSITSGWVTAKGDLVFARGRIGTAAGVLDQANTAGLVSFVGSGDAGVVLDSLYGMGMLSDEVLMALIHRTPMLDADSVAHILINNAPHSNLLLMSLAEREVSIPTDSLDKIYEYQDSTSARKVAVDTLGYWRNELELVYNALLFIADDDKYTTYTIDSVIALLEEETDVNLRLKLADLYMANGQYSEAEAVWDSIPIYYNETRQHINLRRKQLDMAENGLTLEDLNGDELGNIADIAGSNTKAAWQAKAMLIALGLDSILIDIEDRIYSSPKAGSEEFLTEQSNDKESTWLRLYPNPANNTVTLDYSLQEDQVGAIFSIYDLFGKTIGSYKAGGTSGSITVDISGLPNGIYICNLQHQTTRLWQEKMVIVR